MKQLDESNKYKPIHPFLWSSIHSCNSAAGSIYPRIDNSEQSATIAKPKISVKSS